MVLTRIWTLRCSESIHFTKSFTSILIFIPDETQNVSSKMNGDVVVEMDSGCSRQVQRDPGQDSASSSDKDMSRTTSYLAVQHSERDSQQETAAHLIQSIEGKVSKYSYIHKICLCSCKDTNCATPSIHQSLMSLSCLIWFRSRSSRLVIVTSLSWSTTTAAGAFPQQEHWKDWTS